MVGGARPLWPVIFALALGNRQIVDAGEASAHQAVLVELPVLIAVGAEPLAAIVMPFIGKAYRNPVVGKRPYFFDQPIVEFARPFALQELHNLIASLSKLDPVPPLAVKRIRLSDALGIARVPRELFELQSRS